MLIKLNSENLNMQILVGVNEEYKPTAELLSVNEELEELREETNQFLMKNWGSKEASVVMAKLDKSPEEVEKWKDYLTSVYNVKLQEIINKIESLNKKYCKGFTEFIEKKKQMKAKSKSS